MTHLRAAILRAADRPARVSSTALPKLDHRSELVDQSRAELQIGAGKSSSCSTHSSRNRHSSATDFLARRAAAQPPRKLDDAEIITIDDPP